MHSTPFRFSAFSPSSRFARQALIRQKHQGGFTLVEMAIVLVIIGLLLGGVLKGQELVVQARVKAIINDFNQVTAAYYTYFDRYKRFPGDDSTSETRWSTTTKGDGNGVIGTRNSGWATGTENLELWRHLRAAGIVSGSATDNTLPVNSVGGLTGIQDGGFGLSDTVICTSMLPGKIAELIDYAIDDGDAKTGILLSDIASTPSATVSNSSPGNTYQQIISSGLAVSCRKL